MVIMSDAGVQYSYDLKGKRVWVCGHRGMVGSALMRRLEGEGCTLLTVPREDVDLTDQAVVFDWVANNRPDVVFMAAARVGGIMDNADHPADFFYQNMMIAGNVIHSCYKNNTDRLLYIGSSCIYPKECAQPMKEADLLSGSLESTNEAYALAKIGGLKMVEYYRRQYGCSFISAMPCNLFGVGDRYDARASHVIPAMILKAHRAKVAGDDHVMFWGSGTPLREFMDVDAAADALVYLMRHYDGEGCINIGSGEEISIQDLAVIICNIVGFDGEIKFDSNKPDGVMRKVLDSTALKGLGWGSEIWQKKGMVKCLEKSYQDYLGRYGDQEGSNERFRA